MSRIYQSESNVNFQGSAKGANFQPVQAASSSKAIREYKEALAQESSIRNKELERRDRAETLQNKQQYAAAQTQLALETQSDKLELEMDQTILNNQADLDQLVEKQSLERIKDQQALADTKVKTVYDTFASLLQFGNAGLKYSQEMDQVRKEQEKERKRIAAEDAILENGAWVFASDYDRDLGGADTIVQGSNQLVVENFEEQAIVDAAPNDPIAQERLRSSMGVNQTSARINSQLSVGEASQQVNGKLFGRFFDPNTRVTLPDGTQVSPLEVTDPRELSAVIKILAQEITAEMGVGRGDREDRLAAIKLYVPRLESAMVALESQMMMKVISARQNNSESQAFSAATQTLNTGDVTSAWREYFAAAWGSGKYNGDKGKATRAALEGLLPNATAGQLRELENEPVYFNKDGTPGPLFKNDKRFNEQIRDRIDEIDQGLIDQNNRKKALQSIELSNATNAFTEALLNARTPEETVQANQAYETKLQQLSDSGNAKAREELVNQMAVLDNYNPKNANTLRDEIQQGKTFSEEFLQSQLSSGRINTAEYQDLKRRGLATPQDLKKVFGGKLAYEAANSGVKSQVAAAIQDNPNVGLIPKEILSGYVSGMAQDIIRRRDIAVAAYLQQAPDATPGDVQAFADRWEKDNIPRLISKVSLDGDSQALTGYEYLGQQDFNPQLASAANGYQGLTVYSNAYTGKTGVDYSPVNLAALRNARYSGALDDLRSNKIFTTAERTAASLAYRSGDNYPPSVIAKANALGVNVNDLVKLQAEGAGFPLGERPTQDIPVIQELDNGGPVNMQKGYEAIKALGVPPRGAAYIAGNIQQESSWNGMREWGEVDGDGTYRNGGLVSWASWVDNPARLGKIENYLGKSISQASHYEQLQAMMWEMRNEYKTEYRIFMNPNATDAQLRRASENYWGYRDVGSRFTYAQQLMN